MGDVFALALAGLIFGGMGAAFGVQAWSILREGRRWMGLGVSLAAFSVGCVAFSIFMFAWAIGCGVSP